MSKFKTLDELFEVIKSRKGGNIDKSHVAKLFYKGRKKIAQKLGEEAVETVIEAIANDKDKTISESADLLFHLLILWADMEIAPSDIIAELEKRKGKSGIEEKKSRKK